MWYMFLTEYDISDLNWYLLKAWRHFLASTIRYCRQIGLPDGVKYKAAIVLLMINIMVAALCFILVPETCFRIFMYCTSACHSKPHAGALFGQLTAAHA